MTRCEIPTSGPGCPPGTRSRLIPYVRVAVAGVSCSAMVIACMALGWPAPVHGAGTAAAAGCGGVESVGTHNWHEASPPPLALGDSTMLLSLPELSEEGFDGNARGCRQYPEALSLLEERRRSGTLPKLVVIALGANGQVTPGDIDRAVAILGPGRVLAVVTHLDPGHVPGSDTSLIRSEARRYPGRVVVLDWIAYSAGHAEWFQPDGLHLTLPGAAAFGRFLGSALVLATPPQSLKVARCKPMSAQTPVPGGSVTVHPSHGTLPLIGAHSVALRLSNTQALPALVQATLRLNEGTRPVIATNCFALAPQSSEIVRFVLGRHILGELALTGRLLAILRLADFGPNRARTVSSHFVIANGTR